VDDVVVARGARNEIAHVLLVVNDQSGLRELGRGRWVTPDAPLDAIRRFVVLEVAQVARRLGDRDVVTLDDLRVAAGAPQLLASPQLAEMIGMVEKHAVEVYLTFQLALRMAA
jgi:hypothetical protein